MSRRIGLLVLMALPFLSSIAHAGFLRMKPELMMQMRGAEILLTGTVKNEGDEAATDVRVEIISTQETSPSRPKLDAGASVDINMTIKPETLSLKDDGLYYLPIRVLYRDTNSYPFSGVHLVSIVQQAGGATAISSPVEIRVDAAEFSEKKIPVQGPITGKITLRNLRTEPVQGRLMLYGPRELDIHMGPMEFDLPASGEKVIETSLENKSGLLNSAYAVFAVVDGTVGTSHFAENTSFQLTIQGTAASASTGLTLVGLAGLVLVIAALVAWSKRRARPS